MGLRYGKKKSDSNNFLIDYDSCNDYNPPRQNVVHSVRFNEVNLVSSWSETNSIEEIKCENQPAKMKNHILLINYDSQPFVAWCDGNVVHYCCFKHGKM